jgi:transcriptional regulator
MYVNAHFKVHPATSLAFAAARGFGLVIATDAGRPVASPLPFRLIEQDGKVPKLEFHVARANPLAQIAEKGGTWLVAVQGHDAYVSPDWYASADQVPTWLYEAVHLSGPVRVIGGDHTRSHTERLSDTFEKWLAPKPEWKLDKVTDKRRDMLLKAIVAVEMTIETIEGNFKLNQHKSDEDHVAIARALARQTDPSAQAIAERMVALRPHLAYHEADAPSSAQQETSVGDLVAAK